MNDNKRCFVQWFGLVLCYAVSAFFATVAGIPQAIWHSDPSHMTSVIAAVFVVATAYLGFASFRYSDSEPTVAGADSNLGHVMVYIVTLLGLLGTTLGLIAQNKAMGAMDLTNSANAASFIPHVLLAIASALQCTACGIVASIGLYFQCENIDYFLDRRP
jgi:MotA/TolQ/ExbB proton channel family